MILMKRGAMRVKRLTKRGDKNRALHTVPPAARENRGAFHAGHTRYAIVTFRGDRADQTAVVFSRALCDRADRIDRLDRIALPLRYLCVLAH